MRDFRNLVAAISDRMRAFEIREVVYFHCDHFEPWQHASALGEDAAKIAEFVDAVQQVDFARRLTLFYLNGHAARLARDDELVRAVPDDPLGFVPRSPAEREVRGEPMRYLQAHSNHDVQVHIHHEGFTFTRRPDGAMAALEESRALDGSRLECAIDLWFEAARREFGYAPGRWFFVHGLWSLNASDMEGCTIEDEIVRLMRKGCRGDFTFPAGRPHCDPHFEAPYFCLPPAQPKGYDSDSAFPEFAWGNRAAATQKFFIWNSPIKASSASLDWGHPEIRRGFAEPERLAHEILDRSFRWDGVLFIKTHAHSLHEMNRDGDGRQIHPHCYGPIRDLYGVIFDAAAASGAAVTFATAGEVYDRFVCAPQPATVPPMSAFRPPPLGNRTLDVPPIDAAVQDAAERLNRLATAAIAARVEALGVDGSGAEPHYATLAQRGSVVPRHDWRAASILRFLFGTRWPIDEIGAGIGTLPLLLAALGIRARGIEHSERRYEACLAVASHVERHWGAALPTPEYVHGSFPECVEREDLSDRLAVVTDFTRSASPDERRNLIAGLRRYRGVLLELDHFISRISSLEERRALIAEFRDAGIAHIYDVDISPAHAFVLIVNDERLLQDALDWFPAEDAAESAAPRSLAEFAERPESERVALTLAAHAEGVPLMGCWASMDPAMTDDWAWRAAAAAEWLGDAQGVADIGCGNMTLERYLRPGQRYVPIDLVARDGRTVVVDLNTAELPPIDGVDACAVLGVLEYLIDLPHFLAQLRARFAHAVVTFVCRREGETEAARLAMGWLNHHDCAEIRAEFEAAGFRIEKDAEIQPSQRLFRLSTNPAPKKAPALSSVAAWVRERRLTYLGPAKLQSLEDAIATVKSEEVPGDFAEFGLALGGSAIFIASELDAQRRFFGFDVFATIPPPSAEDGEDAIERYRTIEDGQSTGIGGGDPYYGYIADLYERVCESFAQCGLPVDGDRIKLVRGRFEETLPQHPGIRIALAHIDCDWYRPVRDCLDYVCPRLSAGGLVIVDDYNSWDGCRRATDEFCAAHPEIEILQTEPHAVLRRRRSDDQERPSEAQQRPQPPGDRSERQARLREKLAPWTGHYGFDGRPRSELLRQGETLLSQNPLDAEGWALVGRASHLAGETRFAAAAIAKAVANCHPDPQLPLYLARLQCEIGEPAQALAALPPDGVVEPDGLAFVTGVCHLTGRDAVAALRSMTSAAARDDRYAVPARWAHHYLASVFGEAVPSGFGDLGGLHYRAAGRLLPDDRPIVTVLDYKSPDLRCCSDNLGDYMQTYAVLQQLARLERISCSTSDPALTELLSELRGAHPPADGNSAADALHLEVLDRDAAWLDAKRFGDRRVWALIYGWHYHRSFLASSPLPAPDNIEPIVFSFHLADPGLIEPGLLDWLKRFEPIGCRDWNTVAWLLNQGIDAFFSGCVTATLPASEATARRGRFGVDVAPDRLPPDAVPLSHAEDWLRIAGMAQTMRRCRERLAQYAAAAAVTTSRLHCYMPCRALGTPVDFAAARDADLRFEGLVGIDDDELRRMAANLTRWFGNVVGQIATGAEPPQVRKVWRESTQEHVAAARARFGIAAYAHPIGTVRPARQSSPVDVHLTLVATPETAAAARVTIASALRRTAANVTVTVLGKGLDLPAMAGFGSDLADAQSEIRLIAAAPEDDCELLSLADAVPEMDRIIHLAAGSLVLGDVAELARYEPGAGGIAARPSPLLRLATLAHAIEERTLRLDAGRAQALRSMVVSRIDFAGPYFDPTVCVASLERLRRLDAPRRCRALCCELGVDEWLALQLLGDGAFAALPAEWNANPYAAMFTEAKLIQWHDRRQLLSAQRPVLMGEVWRQECEAIALRALVETADGGRMLAPPFVARRGAGWTAILPEACRGYSAEQRLRLILHEEGRQLGPANAMEADICASGSGRYAVWPNEVCFSTSDGSDPNTNGRRYWLMAG